MTRIESIQKARFDPSRIQHISDATPEIIEKFQYVPGDIALSHINSLEHVGKTALIEGEPTPLIHGMNLLRLRLGHRFVLPRFARFCYMQTDAFRQEVRERSGQAVNQVSINQRNLTQIAIPVAPLAEQRRIVAKVEELLARVNAARARLAKVPALVKRFRQSVLASAFDERLTADFGGSTRIDWRHSPLECLVADGPQNGLYKPRSAYGRGVRIVRIRELLRWRYRNVGES